MKKIQTLLGLALCGVLLNVGGTVFADSGKPGYATVVRVKGLAQYSLDAGAHMHALVPGKFLDAGSTIYTGTNGVVDVVLGKAIDLPQAEWVPLRVSQAVDSPVRGMITYTPAAEQNVIRVLENSTLAIDKLNTLSRYEDSVADTELNLKQGSIYASVKKLSPADQYFIKTPKGMAGVRGTQFSISLKENGDIQSVAVYKVQDPNGGVMLAPDGATPPFPIVQGQMWQFGSPSVVPMPPTLMNYLQLAFAAVRTIYVEVVNYDYDHTKVIESTDFGGY